MNPRRFTATIFVTLTLVAAACSGEDPAVRAPATTTQPPEVTTAVVQEPAAAEPAEEAPVVEADVMTEPEPVTVAAPALVVDPVEVDFGINTFTVSGSGFDPNLTVRLLVCPLQEHSLSIDSPAEEVVAAMAAVAIPGDCVLFADVAPAGDFTVDLDVDVQANFMWFAGDELSVRGLDRVIASVQGNPMWLAGDETRARFATAAVFLKDEAPPEPAPTTTAAPEPAPTTTAAPEPAPTTTAAPEPAPTTTAAPEPAPTTTAAPEPAPTTTAAPEPAPTTTLVPEPAVVVGVSEPLRRCAVNFPGATRLSVLTGNTAHGFYEPVVEGGDDSCEQIMAAWDNIRQAEADRIARGEVPCEYPAAYSYQPFEKQTNGPAILVGCWPRLLSERGVGTPVDDPQQEAARLKHQEGTYLAPPNDPAVIEALYDCYRDALEGPPPGWVGGGGEWVTVSLCNLSLTSFGNPVQYFGVTPECAAVQYTGQIEERKIRGIGVFEEYPTSQGGTVRQYAGDWSWANCATTASRLIPGGLDSFEQHCEAVIDASANDGTAAVAEKYGLELSDYIEQMKAMYCAGTRANLLDYPQFHGEWVASWLPVQGSVCFESALLMAAHKGVNDKGARVAFC